MRTWEIPKTMSIDFFIALCDRFDFFIMDDVVIMREREHE